MRRGMHAQRCPVAKLLAENQKNANLERQGTHSGSGPFNQFRQKQCHGIKSILAEKDKTHLPNQHQAPQKKGKKSLFKTLQKEDRWGKTGKGNASQREPIPQKKGFSENGSVHGSMLTQGHRQLIIPKGMNYPMSGYIDSRQTSNAERLKNWRRSSLNIALNPHQSLGNGVMTQELNSSAHPPSKHCCATTQLPMTSFSLHVTPSSRTMAKPCPREEFQLQGPKPWPKLTRTTSFFPATCAQPPVDNKLSHKILSLQSLAVGKPGASGLLNECTNRNMGVSF